MAQATARLLLGGPIAQAILATVTDEAAAYRAQYGHAPALAVVVCGHEAPSMVYLRQILRGCEKAGLEGRLVEIEGEDPERGLIAALRGLADDPVVAGIIVQMPLPATVRLRPVVEAIDPAKDIDGIHPLNAGLVRLGYDGFVPATAHATLEILKGHGIEIAGREAVVVGRSTVVGMPVAFLLVSENATVTVCHSQTRDLRRHLRGAEIVVVAAGHPGLVTGDMLRRGAVVVDVGINVVDGRLVGDVDFAVGRAGRLGDHARPRRGRAADQRAAAGAPDARRPTTGRARGSDAAALADLVSPPPTIPSLTRGGS